MRVKFIAACLIGLILIAGCSSIEPNKKKILTITDVKKAFENTGPELIQIKEPIKKELWINGVKPTVFKFDPYFDDRLFVYIFKSSEEREKGRKSLSNNNPFQEYLNEQILRPSDYVTKNVLLIVTHKVVPMRNTSRMQNVLVNELNKGENLAFEGKGEYWVATYKYNFYSNSDTNEESSIPDNYCIEEATINFIGENPESIGRINFELKSGVSGYFGENAFYPKGGNLYFGGGGVIVDQLPHKNKSINFNITWKDKEEKFELKLKE